MNNIINNIRSLGLNKLVAIGVVLLGLILSLSFLAIDTESKKVILYENLETKDVEGITEHLSKNHIPYNLSNDAKTVFVAPTDVPNARLILAKQNLPNSGSLGYELFDKEGGFSATQFKQKINEKRALEGELERSIRLIQGIIGVRVHIVIPDREMFSSVRQSAQASMLEPFWKLGVWGFALGLKGDSPLGCGHLKPEHAWPLYPARRSATHLI